MSFTIITLMAALAAPAAGGLVLASKENPARSIQLARVRNAASEQFPFHVNILLKDDKNALSWCSGSLISNEWVLTAAHCVRDIKEAEVHLGVNQKFRNAQVMHKVTQQNAIIHPAWVSETMMKDDIALIKIPFTHYSESVQAVKLPTTVGFYDTYIGDEVITSGWCRVMDSSSTDILASNLSDAHMSIIPNSQCRRYYGKNMLASNICVASYSGLATCISSAGSPLILRTTQTQIGLTSYECRIGNQKYIPAVFTRITYYLDWIKDNTGISA